MRRKGPPSGSPFSPFRSESICITHVWESKEMGKCSFTSQSTCTLTFNSASYFWPLPFSQPPTPLGPAFYKHILADHLPHSWHKESIMDPLFTSQKKSTLLRGFQSQPTVGHSKILSSLSNFTDHPASDTCLSASNIHPFHCTSHQPEILSSNIIIKS